MIFHNNDDLISRFIKNFLISLQNKKRFFPNDSLIYKVDYQILNIYKMHPTTTITTTRKSYKILTLIGFIISLKKLMLIKCR
jgi:hypothetical protein